MIFLGFLYGVQALYKLCTVTIEDCAKDGGEEFFTEMHCVRIKNLK